MKIDYDEIASKTLLTILSPILAVVIYFVVSFILGGMISLVLFDIHILPHYVFFWTPWECLTWFQKVSRTGIWILSIFIGISFFNETVLEGFFS